MEFPPLVPWLQAAAVLLLVHAALHDVAARTVPNRISAALAFVGVGLRLTLGDLALALLAAAAVFVAGFCLWLRGWLGGGDVKLLAALSLALPPGEVPALLALVAIAGGVLALLHLLLRPWARPAIGRPRRLPARVVRAESWRIARCGPLPYAVAIAAGGLPLLLN